MASDYSFNVVDDPARVYHDHVRIVAKRVTRNGNKLSAAIVIERDSLEWLVSAMDEMRQKRQRVKS